MMSMWTFDRLTFLSRLHRGFTFDFAVFTAFTSDSSPGSPRSTCAVLRRGWLRGLPDPDCDWRIRMWSSFRPDEDPLLTLKREKRTRKMDQRRDLVLGINDFVSVSRLRSPASLDLMSTLSVVSCVRVRPWSRAMSASFSCHCHFRDELLQRCRDGNGEVSFRDCSWRSLTSFYFCESKARGSRLKVQTRDMMGRWVELSICPLFES